MIQVVRLTWCSFVSGSEFFGCGLDFVRPWAISRCARRGIPVPVCSTATLSQYRAGFRSLWSVALRLVDRRVIDTAIDRLDPNAVTVPANVVTVSP
jgi:hypothetical protein